MICSLMRQIFLVFIDIIEIEIFSMFANKVIKFNLNECIEKRTVI